MKQEDQLGGPPRGSRREIKTSLHYGCHQWLDCENMLDVELQLDWTCKKDRGPNSRGPRNSMRWQETWLTEGQGVCEISSKEVRQQLTVEGWNSEKRSWLRLKR